MKFINLECGEYEERARDCNICTRKCGKYNDGIECTLMWCSENEPKTCVCKKGYETSGHHECVSCDKKRLSSILFKNQGASMKGGGHSIGRKVENFSKSDFFKKNTLYSLILH